MSEDRGSVSVVVAASVAALLLLGLGVRDLAVVALAGGRAASAADAAALAAVQAMAMPPFDDPRVVAAEYAERNGAELVGCRCEASFYEADVTVAIAVGGLWLAPDGLVVRRSARAVVDLPPPIPSAG
ncbi:MAG: pilus assembly protein TadG-related protein [Actinomycetota bacterium]